MGADIHWRKRTSVGQAGESSEVYVPAVEPHFLAEFWAACTELQTQEVFDLRLRMPKEVSTSLSVAPHFDLDPRRDCKDKWEQVPTERDVVLMRHAEAEQLIKFNKAIAAVNNVVSAATRALSMTLENLKQPIERERKQERMLASVIREASTIVNKLAARATVLSESLTRRDLMLTKRSRPDQSSSRLRVSLHAQQRLGSGVRRGQLLQVAGRDEAGGAVSTTRLGS